MAENATLTRAHLKTPKAAAIAGIAFSGLLIAIIWLPRRSIPADPLAPGAWLATDSNTVALALNIVPFAGGPFCGSSACCARAAVARVNDLRVLNGIFWVLRSGAPWRDLPESFGPYTTCYNRFRSMAAGGRLE